MRAIGIILAGGNSERLKDLCKVRAIAAMPVVSSYRAIDFSLSNMSNSGIKKVAVITQFNSRSLQDHLSSAKWWELDRKRVVFTYSHLSYQVIIISGLEVLLTQFIRTLAI